MLKVYKYLSGNLHNRNWINLIKNIIFKSITVLSFMTSSLSYANICINTSSNYKMFGTAFRSFALARGHQTAFKQTSFKNYTEFSAESEFTLAQQLQKMSNNNCSIILGLFTSRECLIAGPILKANKLIGVSSSCGHEDIRKSYPYLYTIIPSLNDFSNKIAQTLNNKTYNLLQVYAIYQPTDTYSVSGLKSFEQIYKGKIHEIPVSSDTKFDANTITNTDAKKTIIFFTYPLPSVNILIQLSDRNLLNKNTSIIGAASWSFDQSVFRPIKSILESVNSVIAVDVIDRVKIKDYSFTTKFIKENGREPLNIEILTYDVTKISIQCYKQALIKKHYSKFIFQNCMTNTKFHGVSGSFYFDKNSPFAHRPLYLINFLERIQYEY